jgi:hypothetical protein
VKGHIDLEKKERRERKELENTKDEIFVVE